MAVRRVTRLALLLLGAMVAMHAARSLLLLAGGADRSLVTHGHGDVRPALAAMVVGAAVVLAALLLCAARSRRGDPVARRLWPVVTVALIALYAGQELAQGWSSTGHPAGLESLVADGGWIVAPVAVGFGILIALTLRVARAFAAACRRRVRAPRLRGLEPPRPAHLVLDRVPRRERPLARHRAGRAPPPVCS